MVIYDSSSLSSIVQFPSLLDDCFGAGGGASFLGGIHNAPNGNVPVGVNPFNCRTLSDSSRNTENTRAILPMARILFRITSLRAVAAGNCIGTRALPITKIIVIGSMVLNRIKAIHVWDNEMECLECINITMIISIPSSIL
ncbi:hypothetical protein DERF_011909 [Dermatophagoides farinae]|uniref:Uncharacterized protein n=1 Tax=Dermatophagoides farinae TaxID=6954 RepID=A0A922HNV0_DERFA|nr:hypothetical protein DERF_011909 [Dermatophagoides farinae]